MLQTFVICKKCSVDLNFQNLNFYYFLPDLIIIIVFHLLKDLFLSFKLGEIFFFVIRRFDLI